LETEKGLWQDLVKAKYLQNKNVGTVNNRIDDSPVWKDLLKVKHVYLAGRQVNVRNGKSVLFWRDIWLDDRPLCLVTPTLFDLCVDKDTTVFTFLVKGGQLEFTRWLPPFLFEQWVSIVNLAFQFNFQNANDVISWKWGEENL
jgi:hypothetical protein